MENLVGTPVRGNNLKFRDKDIEEIIRRLSSGNVMLLGLRRIGKSSVMWGVHDHMPDTWHVKYHDLQGMLNPTDFFSVLLKSLPPNSESKLFKFWKKTKAIPDRVLNYIKKHFTKLGGTEISNDIINYWAPLTEGIEHIIKEFKQPILIILDEFPYLLENMLKSGIKPNVIEMMLGQLREWRNVHSHLHFFIGGSISLDHFLSRNGISGSTISDFSRYFLPPLKKQEAELFLKELAESYDLYWYDESMTEESLSLVEDYYPFFLQALFMYVRSHGGPKGQTLNDIHENYFIPSIEKDFFKTFLDRLKNHYTKDQQRMAKVILGGISNQLNYVSNYSQIRDDVSTLTINEDIDLDDLLNELVWDEFLTFNSRTNEYSFVSRFVAKRWKATRGRK